jgi:hypothetical protein
LPHLKVTAWLALLFAVLVQIGFFGLIGLWLGFWFLLLSSAWLKRETLRSEEVLARDAKTKPALESTAHFSEEQLLSHYGIYKRNYGRAVIYCYGTCNYDRLSQAIAQAEWDRSRQGDKPN